MYEILKKSLLDRMEKLGRETLLSRVGETDEKELLLGFHRPPHNSVFHLHLHVVYPHSKMNAKQKKRICNGGWTTIKQLRKRLTITNSKTLGKKG